jgi:hypothetical protein
MGEVGVVVAVSEGLPAEENVVVVQCREFFHPQRLCEPVMCSQQRFGGCAELDRPWACAWEPGSQRVEQGTEQCCCSPNVATVGQQQIHN